MDHKGVLKQLAEEKLNAFATGNMRKQIISRRKLKEQKQKEDDEAIGHVFQEFFTTFQEPSTSTNKVWVKGGVYNPELKKEDAKEKGRMYKPISRSKDFSSSLEKAKECAQLLKNDTKPYLLNKKRDKEGKKSNLELLKEEMKQIQEEREERHKMKEMVATISESDFQLMLKNEMDIFNVCDPNTTNLYLGNLNPVLSESQLMDIFGKFGPLASVKIMYPRTEEEKTRGHNCGFVAFMNRMDGERALRNLNGKDISGYELRVSWGKCVPIPSYPIYIPPAFQELSQPPPLSGLPFNAQPIESLQNIDRNDPTKFNELLSQSIIKVVIPLERKELCTIHRMIEFVIREGPLFEAMIMKKEINNPLFRFLYDNTCYQHIYYRWKLFSIMQGDNQKDWRTDDFRMFEGGSIWRPPPINIYTRGMPEHLIDSCYKDPSKSLSVAQKDRFEQLLENLTPDRLKIAEVMTFALQHCKAAYEICNYILEKIQKSTNLKITVACLYLISDILSNCSQKITNINYYKRAIDTRIIEMFGYAFNQYKNTENNQIKCAFYLRIFRILDAWKKLSVFSPEFIAQLGQHFEECTPFDEFIDNSDKEESENENSMDYSLMDGKNYNEESDIDGISLSSSPASSPDVEISSRIHVPSKWD